MADEIAVTIVDDQSFSVTESVEKIYSDSEIDAEILVLQENIVTYQARIDYLNSLKGVAEVSRAEISVQIEPEVMRQL